MCSDDFCINTVHPIFPTPSYEFRPFAAHPSIHVTCLIQKLWDITETILEIERVLEN